jgi:hypothetical protein
MILAPAIKRAGFSFPNLAEPIDGRRIHRSPRRRRLAGQLGHDRQSSGCLDFGWYARMMNNATKTMSTKQVKNPAKKMSRSDIDASAL